MRSSAAQLLKLIQHHRLRLFSTADLRTLSGMAPSALTHALRRLAENKLVKQIKRGVWVNEMAESLHPYEALPYLAAPWPAYISLHSALADAGLIEEVPQVITAVSPKKPARYQTSLGNFHIHHLPEHLLWGYGMKRISQANFPMAEPEKAFLDLAYLALIPRCPLSLPYQRSKRWALDTKKLRKYAARFQFEPLIDYLKRSGL